MKLLLLHGPGIEVSRKKLLEIKKKFNENDVVVFEKGADPKDVLGSLQTPSIFNDERLIVWENPPEDIISDSSLITYHSLREASSSLILWFDHEVKKLPDQNDVEILFFPEAKEVSVFPFLDMLANKNPKAFLELDKLKKGGFDSQYIITMICYLLRSLIYIPKTSPEFVRKKVARQRTNFSLEDIKNLYKFIIETDFKIKKGLMEAEQAEFLLLTKFCNL